MSYYNTTEEQQFNEAKNWFKQNGTPIVLAIAVISAATFGWNYWKKHQQDVAEHTSAQYQQVMENYLQNPTKNQPLIEKFTDEFKSSNYALFAQLEQVKQLVTQGNFAEVKTQLEQILANATDPILQNVIRYRLANVQYQLNEFDNALATLTHLKDNAWLLRKLILTGDILTAKGDIAAAKSAYQQAKANAPVNEQSLIDIRLNNL